jgi:polysaccharide export outer membrane protein
MHNKDVLFAANAQSVNIEKFTTFLNALISVANGAASTGVQAETWRILSSQR